MPGLRGGGGAEADAAWQALALGSAVAGALFVVIVDGIVHQLHHAARVSEAENPALLLPLLVVLAQGYVQVFFGYVENYALLVLALAYYVRCALSYLNGRGSLPAVVFSGLVALCVHLSAAVLLPSLAFVVGVGFQRRLWRSFWSELAAGGLAVTVVLGLLSQLGLGYDLARTLLATIGRVATLEGDGPGTIGSGAHALNVLNEQILLGPIGLAMVGAGLVGVRGSRGHAGVRRFLLALAAPSLVVALIAGDSNLGYARNWDLLAPTGFVFALTGVFLLLEQAGTARLRNAALALGLALSLFHTAPWIAVNASRDRGVARFATLPLGGGRTESTLGCWFFRQGNYPEAERWLDRAIAVNPRNPRAHYWAGRLYSSTGRIEDAAAAFDRAHQIRPDVVSFRLAWINSQVRLGRLEPALRESDELVRSDGSNRGGGALLGAVLGELGRSDAARGALERASLLEPGEARTERLARMLGPDGSSLRIPREDLDALTGM
jgi:tetratricopeptide (TPR) repeat protein